MKKIVSYLWPQRLQGQILLVMALALLLAQSINAALIYGARQERRDAAMVHSAAMRLFVATRQIPPPPLPPNPPDMAQPYGRDLAPPPHIAGRRHPPADLFWGPRAMRFERAAQSPLRQGELRMAEAERELRRILEEQNIAVQDVIVIHRAVSEDPKTQRRLTRRAEILGQSPEHVAESMLVAAVQRVNNPEWLVVRVVVPPFERGLLFSLLGQTLFIYALLVGAMALILRRISRPLALLAERVESFTQRQHPAGPLLAQGPQDVRRLIVAHNAMEARIAGLLDEKDVMLGAIGHDLKTPLTALRVRIESVEDESERARMAATIEDITRTLDDILSLARVGRPTDVLEPVELYSLVASVIEEFEDMGQPVEMGATEKIIVSLRATWVRRALRNLVSNAVRYGHAARVSLHREAGKGHGQSQWAVIRVDDDGAGIADGQMEQMLQPFMRGEVSRNSETGGAGLGLTLAHAIAQQHG
ncbi:MAG: hypothetical protein RLY97_130, partial [Pseudomonadota bacterium]